LRQWPKIQALLREEWIARPVVHRIRHNQAARPPERQILSGALQFFPGTPHFIPPFFGRFLRLAFFRPEAPAKKAAGAKAAGTDLATDQAIF
jgi:hypothetical protein